MKTFDAKVDKWAMIGTTLIGMGTTAFLFWSVTPDLVSKIIMAIFGAGLPLISVRFLVKKRMVFFWLTVVLVGFSDVSMILSLTATQSTSASTLAASGGEVPADLKRLQKAADDAQKTLDNLVAQQDKAQSKAFLETLAGQIETATASRDAAQAREAAWTPAKAEEVHVNSHAVFMAIPTALFSLDLSRYMTLVFAILVVTVYQGTVISTVSATVRQVRKDEAQASTKPKTKKRARPQKKPQSSIPSQEDFEKEGTTVPATMTEVL